MQEHVIERPSDVAFGCELLSWLRKTRMDKRFRLYTVREWKQLGHGLHEGPGVALVASIDGSPWYGILNGHNSAKYDQKHYDALTDFVRSRSWWWDMGYAWSVSFGPIDLPPEQQAFASMIRGGPPRG